MPETNVPGILSTDTLAEAARKTWTFHFGEVIRHEPATRLGVDIEALHDMRVATRRLRASFEVFGNAFRPKKLQPHLKGLRATGRALGHARDMDVFVQNATTYMESVSQKKRAALTPLLNAWQAERAAARLDMLRYLDSPQYPKFVAAFQAFLAAPKGVTAHGKKPAAQAIPALVAARLEAVQTYQNFLPQASITQLHALRIEFKQLRYTVEFFQEILGQPAKGLIDTIKGLQDHLGQLHDADVACQIIRQFLDQWDDTQASLPIIERQSPAAVITYLGSQYAERHRLMVTFPAVWNEFQQSETLQQLNRLALGEDCLEPAIQPPAV